jgi:hypothetical protein
LTFWPPGPGLRIKAISISESGMAIEGERGSVSMMRLRW